MRWSVKRDESIGALIEENNTDSALDSTHVNMVRVVAMGTSLAACCAVRAPEGVRAAYTCLPGDARWTANVSICCHLKEHRFDSVRNMDFGRSQYVVLRNGLKMPIFGLGTSHDGGYNHEAVVYALKDCNYKLIDTAKRYGCEEMLQMAIKESEVDRQDVFLTSKLWPSDYGFHSAQIACSGSMQRLGVDYLDLYMLHWPHCPSIYPDPKALRQETWRALELMYDEGLLRSIGVSNFLPSHLEELEETASVLPHVNQIEFHPYQNPVQVRKYCESNNIQLEGFCPLAKGRILNEAPIVQIAKKMKKTAAQILIRWSIQNGVVTIPKSTKKHRILENCQVFDFNLSHDDMRTLSLLHDGRRCVDASKVQSKIDTIATDGYKLKLNPNGIVEISVEN